MTLKILTSKEADPFTGIKKEYFGIHFSAATVADAFAGIGMMYASPAGGWKFKLDAHQDSMPPGEGVLPIWKAQIYKDDVAGIDVRVPQWILFDSETPFVVDENIVDEKYDQRDWSPPGQGG